MTYELDPRLLDRGTLHTKTAGRGVWGARLAELHGQLDDLVASKAPWRIGFEAPWTPDRRDPKADPLAARFVTLIAGKIEEIAARHHIECSEVYPASAKVALAGDGRAKKPQMIRAAIERGWIVGEHEADACAVGLVCIRNWLHRV